MICQKNCEVFKLETKMELEDETPVVEAREFESGIEPMMTSMQTMTPTRSSEDSDNSEDSGSSENSSEDSTDSHHSKDKGSSKINLKI